MPTKLNRPLPNSYWVQPNRLLAGQYPARGDEADARRNLSRLIEAGVTFFLNLTEAAEPLRPYSPYLRTWPGIAHHRHPIRDFHVPTTFQMTHILDTIDHTLSRGRVVYLHCWGGIGRTGTVVGCYFVRHGLTPPESLRAIARLRRDIPYGNSPSPETEAQRQMVLNWSGVA